MQDTTPSSPAMDSKPARSLGIAASSAAVAAAASAASAITAATLAASLGNLSSGVTSVSSGGLPPPAPVRFTEGGAEVVVKRNQSKYDFVKVRVWVGDHFYVLSRYLVCRALVSTKINSKDAVQISLDLKRTLVDLGLTDIVQEQFEDFLYKTMLVFGYGETHIARYRMMSSFHRNRVPLLIILAGTACTGKSTLATKLADRLNLSSVLQTDLIFELMCNFSGRKETLYYNDEFASTDALVHEYASDCAVVRQGVTSDIDKCLKDGKSLVIEGFHIDPRLYQREVAVQAHASGSAAAAASSGFSGIVVPFLLTLDEPSHLAFMANSPDPRYRTDVAQSVGFNNLQRVQTYLCDHAREPDTSSFLEIPINVHSFHDTLDLLHDIVLKRIEEEYVVNSGECDASTKKSSSVNDSPTKVESTGA